MWVRFPPVAFSPGFIPGDFLSQSRRLPLLQVVSKNKSFSVGVQSPTEINAPRGCAVILKRICQLSLTRITHQVSRAFDLNCEKGKSEAEIQTDTDGFLSPLRRLFPPPTANSHAETACSDTLTEAGYARYGDENQPTV